MTGRREALPEHDQGTTAGVLLGVLVVLLLLAGASLALRFAHLGDWGIGVALAIAATKAVLVVLIFMELRDERLSVRIAFLAGLALLAVMVALVLADVATRAPAPSAAPPSVEARDRG